MENIYNQVFVDTFLAYLVVPFKDPYIYRIIILFEEYDLLTATFFAVSAAMIALMVNYAVARFIINEPVIAVRLADNYSSVCAVFKKYISWWLLLAVSIPYWGPILSVFAGLFQVRVRNVLILFGLSQLLYIAHLFYLAKIL